MDSMAAADSKIMECGSIDVSLLQGSESPLTATIPYIKTLVQGFRSQAGRSLN